MISKNNLEQHKGNWCRARIVNEDEVSFVYHGRLVYVDDTAATYEAKGGDKKTFSLEQHTGEVTSEVYRE